MALSKKMLFVINPCAGQKRINKNLVDIINIFNRAEYTVITHVTDSPGDGERAVIKYASDVDFVVCSGGDGTFNETVSGVLKSGCKLNIGYIPSGSTNDFANTLGLPTNFKEAAKNIIRGATKSLDIGCFFDRYFSYVASFGIFTKASYTTPQALKNTLGHAAYVLSGIQELSQLKPYTLRFELHNGEVIEDDFVFGAISNSTNIGGVVTLSKELVDLSDGKLELILIRAPKNIIELAECVLSIQKQTYDHPLLTVTNTESIRITAPSDLDWTLDGEREQGREEIEVKCIHNAIDVFMKGDE